MIGPLPDREQVGTKHRRSVRLRGHDYARAGAYFITICSRDRLCLFAEIAGDVLDLTPNGEAVSVCWQAIPAHFPTAELDAFSIMPNHLHGIIILGADRDDRDSAAPQGTAANGTACRAPTGDEATSPLNQAVARVECFGAPVAGSISTIVRSFKGAVTKSVNDDPPKSSACRAFLSNQFGPLPPGRIPTLWQSNNYEHAIRSARSIDHLRAYIATNRVRWIEDSLHSDNSDVPTLGQSRAPRP